MMPSPTASLRDSGSVGRKKSAQTGSVGEGRRTP
jgi:hypothetical protein